MDKRPVDGADSIRTLTDIHVSECYWVGSEIMRKPALTIDSPSTVSKPKWHAAKWS